MYYDLGPLRPPRESNISKICFLAVTWIFWTKLVWMTLVDHKKYQIPKTNEAPGFHQSIKDQKSMTLVDTPHLMQHFICFGNWFYSMSWKMLHRISYFLIHFHTYTTSYRIRKLMSEKLPRYLRTYTYIL